MIFRRESMPTKRIFDLALLTVILGAPALGLVNMALRRHLKESDGALATVAEAAGILL
jgi:hypothetical protein